MNYTDVTLLVDQSGSMNVIRDDVIGGLNTFIEKQKIGGGDVRITLVLFDTVDPAEVRFVERPANECKVLNHGDFIPRGGTPLLDALGKAIVATGTRLAAKPEADRPTSVVFVVMTDGEENSSSEYKKEAIKKMVDLQTSQYSWQFVYLGANQDAFAEARAVGIPLVNAANFKAQNTRAAMGIVGQSVNAYANRDDLTSHSALNYSADARTDLMQD